MNELEKYLKKIAGTKEDKAKRLTDRGDSKKEIVKSSIVGEKNNDLYLVERTYSKAENNSAELHVISGNLNSVYPGAIVHADTDLVDGRPNEIVGAELQRKAISVGLDIFGNTQEPIKIERPNRHRVMAAINKQVANWCSSGRPAAAQMNYKLIRVYDKNQLNVDLGVKGAGDKFKIGFEDIHDGKKTEMLVVFSQIYYTARVSAQTASQLFADSVTPEDLADNGLDEENPLAALVTSVDFGRQIVVKLSSDEESDKVNAAWENSIGSYGFHVKDEYKKILNKTNFQVFVLGGKTDTAAELVKSGGDMEKINAIIASDMRFDATSAAYPISYATSFIDDGRQAVISRSTEYVKTTVTKRGQIHFQTDTASAYVTKHQMLWGRRILDIAENGAFELGEWERLMDEGNGNKELDISGRYAEFGFEFDVTWGTDWPYSGVFWTADKGAVKDIFIDMGGTCRNAKIEIKVNGDRVFYDGDCDSHSSCFGSES